MVCPADLIQPPQWSERTQMSKENPRGHHKSVLDDLLDGLQNWARDRLRPLLAGLVIASLLLFALWLVTVLLMPAFDAQRKRVTIPLSNGSELVVDYPKRFLADELSRPVYLTIDSTQPVSTSLKLSSDLPLILANADPSSAVGRDSVGSDVLVVTWPIIPTTVVSTVTNASNLAGLPVVTDSGTVTLFFKNAQTKRIWHSPGRLPVGFFPSHFQFLDAEKQGKQSIAIETTDRFQWRQFAEKYPFLAILPFLIALVGFLRKEYVDRQQKRGQEAQEVLERFKHYASPNEDKDLVEQYDLLQNRSKYLDAEDWQRTQRIYNLARGCVVPGEPKSNEFTSWTDSWAGALIKASRVIFPTPAVDRMTDDRPSGQSFDGTNEHPSAATPEEVESVTSDLASEKQQPDCDAPDAVRLDKQEFYRYVRTFPIDKLSPSAEQIFRLHVRNLKLLEVYSHNWPPHPQIDPPPTLSSVHTDLFPELTADNNRERALLFSRDTEWFWPGHEQYKAIADSSAQTSFDVGYGDARPVLIVGQPGNGRTALGLALTRYAHREKKVLGAFHNGPATLPDVQRDLALELVRFARWRSVWLFWLEREERDLLARLLLTVLDARWLYTQMGAPEPGQFAEATAGQADTWKSQASLELRLLRQSVERLALERPIPTPQWFLGFATCAQRLKFERVRIALDLGATDWTKWREKQLPAFLRISQENYPVPVQFIILTPDEDQVVTSSVEGVELRVLSWSAGVEGSLSHMLRHRLERCKVPLDSFETRFPRWVDVVDSAQGNPRRLAEIWRGYAGRSIQGSTQEVKEDAV